MNTKTKLQRIMIAIFLIATLTLSLASCGGSGSKSKGELNLYTWQEYVPPKVVERFEKETGVKVNYTTFSTCEEAIAKIEAGESGSFDLVLTSDYSIDLLQKAGDLQSIDISKIENAGNIDSRFQNTYYDPDNTVSVPYWVYNHAILYDPAKTDLKFESFADLADASLKDAVAISDDSRNVIGTSLVTKGLDFNTTDEATIKKALPLLEKLRPNIKAFNTDAPQDLVVNGDAIASYQTGAQAVFGKINNKDLVISYPKESISYGIDAFVIPKDAPNLDNAYMFLSYLLQPDVAALAVNWTHYMNVTLGYEKVVDEDAEINMPELIENGGVAIVPPELIQNGTLATDLGSAQEIYDKIWTDYKG